MAYRIGEKIMLREYMIEDLPYIRAWVNDPTVTKMLSHIFLTPQTYDMTERFLRSILEGKEGGYHFIIANKEDGEYIGQIDLMSVQPVDRIATLGIVIGNPKHQGQGYGSEAIALLLRFAFREANLHKVCLEVYADNARAIRCYEKSGFVREGVRRQQHFLDGKYSDVVLMGVLRSEWDVRQA